MEILKFTFGPFSENTYVLVDRASKECIIVDPGMYDSDERNYFKQSLDSRGLTPALLINTHAHIDHVMGNSFVHDEYGLVPQIHKLGELVMERAESTAQVYGLNYDLSPKGETTLEEGKDVTFNGHTLEVFFTPGHSPDHIVLYNRKEDYIIGGDVLFKGSVGRVDLPGSVPVDLEKSIRTKLYVLPEKTEVHPGHGPETTIGEEKTSNPFVSKHSSSLG
jgi:hydroxyacylglutathione hydrolase